MDLKNNYIPIYALKLDAMRGMRGNMFKALYACVMPAIIISIVASVILSFVPGAMDSVQLIITGVFDSAEAQRSYLIDVMNTLTNAVQLVNVLFCFLNIGGSFMLLGMIRGKKVGYKNLFAFFPQWLMAAVYALINFAISFVLGFAREQAVLRFGTADWITLAYYLMLLFILLKFFFVPYILADEKCKNPIRAIKKSWTMVSLKTMGNIIMLALSFIGWVALAMFTFGASLIFAVPYMRLAGAALYERLRLESN